MTRYYWYTFGNVEPDELKEVCDKFKTQPEAFLWLPRNEANRLCTQKDHADLVRWLQDNDPDWHWWVKKQQQPDGRWDVRFSLQFSSTELLLMFRLLFPQFLTNGYSRI